MEPPTPGTLSVSVSDITANLSVSGASDNRAVTGYAFRVGSGTWSSWQVGSTYTATGLSPATQYTFQHKVWDGAGHEALGVAVTRTTASMAAKTPSADRHAGGIGMRLGGEAHHVGHCRVRVGEYPRPRCGTCAQASSCYAAPPPPWAVSTAVQFDRAAQDYMRYQDTFAIDTTVGSPSVGRSVR